MQNDQYINLFKEFCRKNKFEINLQQIEIIKLFNEFLNPKKILQIFFLSQIINFVFIYTEILVWEKPCYLISFMIN